MLDLVLSFILAMIAITVAYLLFTAVGVDGPVAFSVSSSVLGGFPYLHQNLKRRRIVRKTGAPPAPPSLESFGVKPLLMLVYATLMLMATFSLAGALGGVIAAILESDLADTIAIASALVAFPLCIFVGRFVGRRIQQRGILVVLVSVLLARAVTSYLDLWLTKVDPEMEDVMREMMLFGVSFFDVTLNILVASAFLSLFLLLGYWRGRKARLFHYLSYLLKNVPVGTRNAIVELAYEESIRSAHVPAVNRDGVPPAALESAAITA